MGLHGENSSIHALVEALHDPELYGLSPSMFSFFIIGYNGVRIIQKEKTLVFIVFDFMPVIYLSPLQPGDFLSGGHTDRQYFSDELSYAGYYDCACCHGGPD